MALKTVNMGFMLSGNVSDLSAEMQLVPEPENPFAHHPTPLQAGRKLQATGRSHDAALAFEAAGRVSYHSTSVAPGHNKHGSYDWQFVATVLSTWQRHKQYRDIHDLGTT